MASSNHSSLFLSRGFPSNGCEIIDPSQKLEEERLPFYSCEDYYPLGYGSSSTVWLSHDLKENTYWVLKVHVNTLKHNQELEVYQHLASVTMEHSGHEHIRRLEDSFTLKSRHSEHDVFVMTPLGMSLRALQEIQKNGIFQQTLAVSALNQLLSGLNFLHEADVIHTDLHSDNLLIAITNDSVLSQVEDDEIRLPSARKQVDDTIIYVSRYMLGGAGPLTICDLGQARIGNSHRGKAMPVPYRAPEVILDMQWGNAVDIWSVGPGTFLNSSLFRVYDDKLEMNDAYYLATMTTLLGAPPSEFLKRSKETSKYWSEDGEWRGPVPLPPSTTFDFLAKTPTGDDRAQFLDFVRCLLYWLSEERLTAGQAYYHPWLRERS